MKSGAFLISLILTFIFPFSADAILEFTRADADRALGVLDDSLSHRNKFIERRQKGIDYLSDKLRQHPDSTGLMMQIADHYTAFNNDSALYYLQLGLNHSEGTARIPFLLKQAALMPLTGAFETALDIYNTYPEDSIPAEYLALYYDSGRQMYSYMSAFSATKSHNKSYYENQAAELQQKLIKILPEDSPDYIFNLAEYYFETGKKDKARALLEEVFDTEPTESNLKARAAHHLSSLAKETDNTNAYIYYLAGAALSDITAATREVAALQELGNYLMTENDVDRSYDYLTTALASAVECGASLRVIESSQTLPVIERAKAAQIKAKELTIYKFVIFMIVIMVGLGITLFLLGREMKRMRLLQDRLRDANHTKEIYISQFLNLCSIYMDKLNQFCKIANRKITAGKVDDLYRLTKSGKFVEEQSKEFYDVFDTAFLHMYPDFPQKINALLRTEEQIELKEGELLNTDLRILAFMRLGIEESNRIAQVLNYSVNTIYAYRNRTKARAIDRDTFEDDVMRITSDI